MCVEEMTHDLNLISPVMKSHLDIFKVTNHFTKTPYT